MTAKVSQVDIVKAENGKNCKWENSESFDEQMQSINNAKHLCSALFKATDNK